MIISVGTDAYKSQNIKNTEFLLLNYQRGHEKKNTFHRMNKI